MNLALIASGFVLGLAGSGHCLAMCGGASGWVLRLLAPGAGNLVRFHLGRAAGYGLLGAAVALAGHELQRLADLTGVVRPLWVMANAAAFALGAALLVTGRQPALLDRFGAWAGRALSGLRRAGGTGVEAQAAAAPGSAQGMFAARMALAAQGRGAARGRDAAQACQTELRSASADAGGASLPGSASTAGMFTVPVAAIGRGPVASGGRAWATGVCWALMPCGLLYSALMLAALSGDAASGGLAMAAFALAGAVPMLAVQRLFGRSGWLRRWERTGHRAIGAAICALAGWGVAMTLSGNVQGLFCLPAG